LLHTSPSDVAINASIRPPAAQRADRNELLHLPIAESISQYRSEFGLSPFFVSDLAGKTPEPPPTVHAVEAGGFPPQSGLPSILTNPTVFNRQGRLTDLINRLMTEKEKSLLAGCVKGDKSSWDEFVRQYSSLVYHTIRKTLTFQYTDQRDEVVEDLYQDVFISLVADNYRKLKQFRGDGGCTLASWLRMIAARRTIDHLRTCKKPVYPLDESLSNTTAAEADEERDDDPFQRLAGAIDQLQPRERIIVDFFFRQNLSAQDVAAILRLSVGAVYTQKSRILAKLRETVEKPGSL
jgi:RNA polymerase sigma-70 factor (ECF subfamily)